MNFECREDVEGYFAEQFELWAEPKPSPPKDVWERLEQTRVMNLHQLHRAHRRVLTLFGWINE